MLSLGFDLNRVDASLQIVRSGLGGFCPKDVIRGLERKTDMGPAWN